MAEGQLEERVININRVAKVVKGGRRFSFTALVVVGDGARQGRSRLRQGEGGARRHPEGHRGGEEEPLLGAARGQRPSPIPSWASAARDGCCSSRPRPVPASSPAARRRAILEAAGVHDILAKSLGSSNGINVAHATIAGLRGLKRPDEVAALRGKTPEEVTPAGVLRAYRESRARSPLAHRGGVMAPAKSGDIVPAKRGDKRGRPEGHPGAIGDRHQAEAPGHAAAPSGWAASARRNVLPDRPDTRGMIARVPHLIRVEEVERREGPRLEAGPGLGARPPAGGSRASRARAGRPRAVA